MEEPQTLVLPAGSHLGRGLLTQPPAALGSHPVMGTAGTQGEGCPSSPLSDDCTWKQDLQSQTSAPSSADSTYSADGLSDSSAAPS